MVDYYQVVKKPVCLKDIRQRLATGAYTGPEGFYAVRAGQGAGRAGPAAAAVEGGVCEHGAGGPHPTSAACKLPAPVGTCRLAACLGAACALSPGPTRGWPSVQDMDQLVYNCLLYNPVGTYVRTLGQKIEQRWLDNWRRNPVLNQFQVGVGVALWAGAARGWPCCTRERCLFGAGQANARLASSRQVARQVRAA